MCVLCRSVANKMKIKLIPVNVNLTAFNGKCMEINGAVFLTLALVNAKRNQLVYVTP